MLELMIERYGLGVKRVYPEDCQLCISGYTGKRCKYLKKVKREYFCVRDAVKDVDNRLLF
ncbi:conserved hypothetical protein [Ferroglobus placidus DSM 10642]|uniref:Uncharacterized protein n=1 Tax=Ferroglobus placidus (strain DSM 10642 / AEDII12DO) TaxID=589924 RepID=D3S2F7_FERPA|nr:hypothetical protein [Ferroglobus placidus]ADC64487.1 conserved hypothetical protein [Ferroglobus placidus DSM 10642]